MSSSQELIAVTGANGFLGFHIVQQLVQSGHRTRAIVRSAKSAAPLQRILAHAIEQGTLDVAYVPDILADDHVYDEAFRDATAVVHCASPIFEVGKPTSDPENDFYSPAERGALNALRSAKRITTIKRFVLTGSVVASYRPEGFGTLDKAYISPVERDEARKFTDARMAYGASKAFSERAVWSFVKDEQPTFAVVVLLPGLILGPPVDSEQGYDTGSNSIYTLWAKRPQMFYASSTTAIDVRDCAKAHVQAALTHSTTLDNKRLFVVDRTLRAVDVAHVAVESAPTWVSTWQDGVEAKVKEEAATPYAQLTDAQKGYVVPSAEEDAKALGVHPLRHSVDTLREIFQAASASHL